MNQSVKKYLTAINHRTFPLDFLPKLGNLFPLSFVGEFLFIDAKYYSFILAREIKIKLPPFLWIKKTSQKMAN